MADTKISALPAASLPLNGSELIPLVSAGVTRRVSAGALTASHPGYRAGTNYPATPWNVGNVYSNGANNLLFVPFVVGAPVTISKLSVRVNSGATAVLKLALYTSDGGRPASLIIAAANIDCSTSGDKTVVLATPTTLASGGYWIGCECNSYAVQFQGHPSQTTAAPGYLVGVPMLANAMNSAGSSCLQYSATPWPATMPASNGSNYTPSTSSAPPLVVFEAA